MKRLVNHYSGFLKTFGKSYFQRKTGIICSISSENNSKELLKELMMNGMNIARLNFSHGYFYK